MKEAMSPVGMLVLADIGTIRRGNTMLIMKDGHMVRYGS
jgi:hypothetical protein